MLFKGQSHIRMYFFFALYLSMYLCIHLPIISHHTYPLEYWTHLEASIWYDFPLHLRPVVHVSEPFLCLQTLLFLVTVVHRWPVSSLCQKSRPRSEEATVGSTEGARARGELQHERVGATQKPWLQKDRKITTKKFEHVSYNVGLPRKKRLLTLMEFSHY